jgi:hypothetical protein
MATITNNNIKNAVQIHTEFKENGTKIEYIVIDGQRIGILGSVSERDRNAALKVLNDTYLASNGDIMEMMQKLTTLATIEENEIEPDEMIEVNGIEAIISYKNATAYTIDGEEIVNCADLPSMPKEAIKAVLVARMEAII